MPKVPFLFQIGGVKIIEEKFDGRCLVSDSVGVGKSITALLYYERNPQHSPVVIVCPATIKIKWQREIKDFLEMDSTIIWGTDAPTEYEGFPHEFVIINYELLVRKKTRKKKDTRPSWVDHLIEYNPQLVIIDEGQNISNPSAIRTKAVQRLCKKAPKVLILSATPIENKPANIFTMVNILRPDIHEFSSPWVFYENFCELKRGPWGWEWNGASNLDLLNQLLEEHVLLRRRKEEVLEQLPKLTREVIPLRIDLKKYDEEAGNIVRWMNTFYGKKQYKTKLRTKMNLLKILVADLKLEQQIEWLDEWLRDNDGKIIVGTYHRKIIDQLSQRYSSQCVFIHGGVIGPKRQEAIDSFQTNPKTRIMFGQLKSAGTGWDGTQASAVAVFEMGWNPATHTQLEGRSSRIGSLNSVICYYLVADETIDMTILELNEKKQKIFDQAIDGVEKTDQSFDVFTKTVEALKLRYGGK